MQDKHNIPSKILHRTRLLANHCNDRWTKYVDYKMSRDAAKKLRRHQISIKGKSVIDKGTLNIIKDYSRDTFGSSIYWPWLACYTELRGEFKEGWIPDDYYRFELLPEMNPIKYMRFSEAKIVDHKLFGNHIVSPLFFRSTGLYFNKEGESLSKSEVEYLLKDINHEVIIKPDDGHGGNNIIFKHSSSLNLNELPTDCNLLFQKVVTQHAELSRLYPSSINTFRVLSYMDSQGDIEVKFMTIRFGIGGKRVDNATSGGGWVFVHLDGRPEPFYHNSDGMRAGIAHPDTGTIVADLDLPFVPKVVDLCKKTHSLFPYARIIGWDVFVDEEGEPKLIEWNANNPFWSYIEAFYGPFLKESVVSKVPCEGSKYVPEFAK